MSHTAALGEVVTVKGGGTPSKSNADFWNGDIPWVSPKDMKVWEIFDAEDRITKAAISGSATNLIPTNSVLVVNRSGILKHTLPVGITRRPVAINQDIKALICTSASHPEYIAHMLKAAEPIVLKWVRATTADNFPIDNLRELRVPLPSLYEQRRIAAILDKADALRRKRKRALELVEDLQNALFEHLYYANQGDLETMKLFDLAKPGSGNFGNGPFGSDLLTSELQDTGVPVVYIRDIRDGRYDRISRVCVSKEKATSLPSCHVRSGDVLLAKVGDPPGVAAVYPEGEPDAIITQDVIRLRVNNQLTEPNFVALLLNSSIGRHWIEGITVAATRARFSLGDLKKLPVQLPSLATQRKLGSLVEKLQTERDRHSAAVKKLDQTFSSVQHRAFSGQL